MNKNEFSKEALMICNDSVLSIIAHPVKEPALQEIRDKDGIVIASNRPLKSEDACVPSATDSINLKHFFR